MIQKNFKRILLAVFTFLVIISMAYSVSAIDSQKQKNVLIIHSYNEGIRWTSEQNAGIIDTLGKSAENCAIYVEYMDWKNYPSQDNLDSLFDYFQYKYSDKKIDLIVTTDDAALNFALENRRYLFSGAPIVFSGVNQDKVQELENRYMNFTGVVEEIDPVETINIALKINPQIKKVYLVYDKTESGLSTGKLITEKISQMDLGLEVVPLNNLEFGNLLTTVSRLENTDMLFFATYYSDAAGTIIDFNRAAREISQYSTVPMYHQYDFGLNYGAFGGNMLSGRLYGSYAAELALRILKGEKASDIPVSYREASRKEFDYFQVKRFNIPLNKLPEDALLINKPFSFFDTYKLLVCGVVSAFFVLILFLMILLMYIRKIRRIRRELHISNEELTQTYEELVATDNELKDQLREISEIQHNLSVSEEKYTYLAMHDMLTGLPNRRSLFEDANRILINSNGKKAALLFIDMDNFKYINDTMGHEFGDLLIKGASERLSLDLFENSTLYRLGGDEFIIFAEETGLEGAEQLTADIMYSFREKFFINNIGFHISFSIGIAMYPDHGNTIEDLIKSADIAMYKAKESGKSRYILYDASMNKDFTERMVIEKHLHTAMDNNEFELFYQPQLDLATNRVTGLEALLRWNNPELGYVSPVKFIKVAEDTHMIIELGEWVLIQACDFLSHLHKQGMTNMTMSVNISPLQIFQADFNSKILKIIEYFELDPHFLELEITETLLIESFDIVYEKLRQLREKGIGIALDDFGKGYSSLSYLKQLPITTLKIDKCFIDNVSIGVENKTITRHIIKMGRSMGMSVIAEGVEHTEQLEYLKKYECDKMQGYLFSKPLPKGEVEKKLLSGLISSHDK